MITVAYESNTQLKTFAERLTTSSISTAAITNFTQLEKIPRSKFRIITILTTNPIEIVMINTKSNSLYHIHEAAINTYTHNPLMLRTLSHFTKVRNLAAFAVQDIVVPNGIHIPIAFIYYFIRTGVIEQELVRKLHENIRNTTKIEELADFLMGEYIVD
jgi:hypothetical protein